MLKIKICGLKNSAEITRIDNHCQQDFVGLIFHENSPRNFENHVASKQTQSQKVGVFVNESEEKIISEIKKHRLPYVQLHGKESPELCYRLAAYVSVIKAFSIDDQFSFELTYPYHKACTHFLFDTSFANIIGGTGRKFDWKKLQEYKGENTFFLSGGIGPNDVQNIQAIKHPKLYGLDLNSQFEDASGIKNENLLNYFIQHVRENKNIHTT